MPFNIHYNAEKHYLHVNVTGDMTLSAARQYLADVAVVLKETGATRILIDARKANQRLSSLDLMKVSQMVSESAEAQCKRALVDKPGRSGLSLFESVSRGRGQPIRGFNDLDEALDWLLSDQE